MNIGSGDAVDGAPGSGIPLVDPLVLADLADKLESPDIACRFAADYVALWEARRSRLAAALVRNDFPAAVDAVISLRVASVMVGAERLAWLAQQVEDAINSANFAAGRELMDAVGVCGTATLDVLVLPRNPELALCSRHL
ncbi:Hpt domain-containing protein [Pseudarthrobacter sp. NPDC092419]|uniref:Hpt domain-containing protein n=1 Tax=Pseudarthrobacter sp. NPDC092419 TaxID=3364414 RepID=UPI003817176E